jgi:hypothetical protein
MKIKYKYALTQYHLRRFDTLNLGNSCELSGNCPDDWTLASPMNTYSSFTKAERITKKKAKELYPNATIE